jgi:hypothetical protein
VRRGIWSASAFSSALSPPKYRFDIHKPQVGFVDKRRGLQSMAWTFAAHIGLGQATQFLAPEWSQFFQSGLFPGAPGKEQLIDF